MDWSEFEPLAELWSQVVSFITKRVVDWLYLKKKCEQIMRASEDAVNQMPLFFKGERQGRNWQNRLLRQVRGKQKIVGKWTNQYYNVAKSLTP